MARKKAAQDIFKPGPEVVSVGGVIGPVVGNGTPEPAEKNAGEVSPTVGQSRTDGGGEGKQAEQAEGVGNAEGGDVLTTPEGGDPGAEGQENPDLPRARAKEHESKGHAWERIRKEGRSAGLGRREAYDRATREVERLFPPPPPEPEPEPELAIEPEPEPEPEPVEPEPAAEVVPPPADDGVSGLGRIPPGWPVLPSNASLQAEIAWVQASRLDIVEETGTGTRVDLSRADGPAPSKAAIGWLETSIRAYSKYCDIAAKATAQQEHEAESVRRERMALGDVQALLGGMDS